MTRILPAAILLAVLGIAWWVATVWPWRVMDCHPDKLARLHDLDRLPKGKHPEWYVGWHRAIDAVIRSQ